MNQTTFELSRDTGIKLKEEEKLGEAMEKCKHALALAMTDQERSQIWQLISHTGDLLYLRFSNVFLKLSLFLKKDYEKHSEFRQSAAYHV